jgi:hypothetical protein
MMPLGENRQHSSRLSTDTTYTAGVTFITALEKYEAIIVLVAIL